MSHLNTTTSAPLRSNDRPNIRPRGAKLHTYIAGRLATSATALAVLLSGCDDGGEYTGPTLVSGTGSDASGAETRGMDGGAIRNPLDATGTADDAVNVGADVTPDDVNGSTDSHEVEIPDDTTSETDAVVNDAADDAVQTAKDVTMVDTAMTDTAGKTSDTKLSETKPSTPQEICNAKKAEIVAALKPGEPQCTQTVPGVGKVAGELVCSGSNQDPNCVTK